MTLLLPILCVPLLADGRSLLFLYVKKREKIIEKQFEPGSYIHLPTCSIATGPAWNSNTVMMSGKISCWQLFILEECLGQNCCSESQAL